MDHFFILKYLVHKNFPFIMQTNQTNKTFVYDKLASEKRWDSFANQYETSRRLNLIFNTLLDESELKNSLFLDAGSGGGHFSHAAESLGAHVVSLDVGLNLLKQVGSRCSSAKTAGSVFKIPLKENVFDIVLSTEVIEHTPDPLISIQSLSSVVKPGGLLIVTVPCRLWNPVVNLATVLKLRPYEGYENFLWPGDLRHTLGRLNFSIEKLIGFNFCPFFSEKIDPLFRFFDKMYGRRMPWLMVNIAVRARRK